MRLLSFFLAVCALCVPATLHAADPANGQRLAQARCVPCHDISLGERRDVGDAPPFELIARKFGSPEILAFSLLDPHPRMNVTMTRREAADIAAYIATLAK